MRSVVLALLALLASFISSARADVLYSQPPLATGGLIQSSWNAPDGGDSDQFVWDSFVLPASQAITEVRWRGGYIYNGSYGGHVTGFTLAIYPTNITGNEPDVVHPPLVTYTISGNAGETAAGSVGGISMYDYRFTLPAAFQANAGVRYWLQIVGANHGVPEWGFGRASGGNGSHFRRLSEYMFQFAPGDTAFTLYGSGAATFSIAAVAVPASAGSVMGAGAYPAGSNASLVATPNPGFGFVNWTENGTPVSNSSTYTFPVTADRSLVASFTAAYTISASPSPVYAGTVAGAGTYNSSATVTLLATPNANFSFVNWTEFGTPVSDSASYSFPAAAARTLVANFVTSRPSVLFDLENAPLHTSLPVDISAGGIDAHLSATAGGFSIQPADTLGLTPFGFAGRCIYPNTVFPADLLVSFSRPLTGFSILYAPQELGCDDSATMRVTAFMDDAPVGTATATVPVPGTYPTGTLSITTALPFNRVVVHYDAAPPTCRDYGRIFLADNMIVIPSACADAAVTRQPGPASACYGGAAAMSIVAEGTGPLTFQWERETSPGAFAPLADGVTGTGSVVAGAQSADLLISNVAARDAGLYRCVVFNACATTPSAAAALAVCTADFDCSGTVNSQDFFDFLATFFSSSPVADINRDGAINSQDFFDFLTALFGGC